MSIHSRFESLCPQRESGHQSQLNNVPLVASWRTVLALPSLVPRGAGVLPAHDPGLSHVPRFGQWDVSRSRAGRDLGCVPSGLLSPWENCAPLVTCWSRDNDHLESCTQIISFNFYNYPRKGSCHPICQMKKLRPH